MIRLWPAHHLNDTLETQLIEAFKKYPDCCDEVWFCFEDEYNVPREQQMKNRDKLAKAAADVRELGIIASLQTVTVGHPSQVATPYDTNSLGFRAMTGIDGVHAQGQTCPRDTNFLRHQAEEHAFYCEVLQPESIYIDDDLRITQHYPAESICFCDECMRQFNEQFGRNFTRETLQAALLNNVEGVRKEWITFSQESLAMVGRWISRDVHKVSPQTHMGLQHVNFHFALLEGWDWNKIFDAMEEETGNMPVSRPGHGYYNDHSPRQMIVKAYGISRQIARLKPNMTLIAPEIEGYLHKSTGKSPQSIVTETLLYLSMGATSQSYAIICGNQEPMSWYADTYFKALDKYHPVFKEYVAWNKGTVGGGIDSYISPDAVLRDVRPGEDPWAWSTTTAGDVTIELAPLGVPFSPEGKGTTSGIIDYAALIGMKDAEIEDYLNKTGIVTDAAGWAEIVSRGIDGLATAIPTPAGLENVTCYQSKGGKNIAVLPTFTGDINEAQRRNVMRIFDWTSEGKMRAVLESQAQAFVSPRVTPDGVLRSVVFVNATISEIEGATLRLRDCPANANFKWYSGGNKPKALKATKDGNDWVVTIPAVKAWDAGWIKVGE